MAATAPDLTKLRIDHELAPIRRRRRSKWLWLALAVVLVAAAAAWRFLQPHPQTVQTTPIVTARPKDRRGRPASQMINAATTAKIATTK